MADDPFETEDKAIDWLVVGLHKEDHAMNDLLLPFAGPSAIPIFASGLISHHVSISCIFDLVVLYFSQPLYMGALSRGCTGITEKPATL